MEWKPAFLSLGPNLCRFQKQTTISRFPNSPNFLGVKVVRGKLLKIQKQISTSPRPFFCWADSPNFNHISMHPFWSVPNSFGATKTGRFFFCLQFLSTSCLNINAMCLCHQAYHFEGNGKTKISCGLWHFLKSWLVNDRILTMCLLKDTPYYCVGFHPPQQITKANWSQVNWVSRYLNQFWGLCSQKIWCFFLTVTFLPPPKSFDE